MVFSFLSQAWAVEDLGSLQASFLRGEYEKVFHSAQECCTPGDSAMDGFLYLQGVSALKLGDLPAARKALNQLLDRQPGSRWAPQAWIALGDSWEAAGEHETALQVYSKYLGQGRDASMAPQARLRIGMIRREMGRWDEAKSSLQDVVSRAAGTPEASQAAELLRADDFYFCVQAGAFVTRENAEKLQAVLKRRGYDASVTRAAMNGRMYHRVRVGQFSSRADAEGEAHRLERDGFPAKVIP